MKSLEEITAESIKSLATIEQKQNALVPRPSPMDSTNIQKMDDAINRYFVVSQKPRYGYVQVLDESGKVYRHEYDVIGSDFDYSVIAEAPEQLRNAMLRPAERKHIIYHLTRLSAHRRDTRGSEAFAAFLEDSSRDLVGVSEWAIIMACREMRAKKEVWFPTTAEILDIVKRHNSIIEGLFVGQKIEEVKMQKIEKQKETITYKQKSRDIWTESDWDEYVGDAESMLKLAKSNPSIFDEKGWQETLNNRIEERQEVKSHVKINGAA